MDGGRFFLTQTLKPSFHPLPVKDQMALTLPGILRILHGFSRFRLVTEFTKQGVIHYHAIGVIHDSFKYFRTLNKLREYGFYKIEKVVHLDKCHAYLNKDLEVTLSKLPDVFKSCMIVDCLSTPSSASYAPVIEVLKTYIKEKDTALTADIGPPRTPSQQVFTKITLGSKSVLYLSCA